ncbi:MAG: 2-amino-4-hydroxy-6-hydroxymethyldihydropteridine diphosphokinase [Verrucomicrobiota bacterium]
MELVAISLGSNLGNRLENLRNAIRQLDKVIAPGSLRCSPVYETEPVGCPEGSPFFLNAVIEFSTDLDPEELLDTTQNIEHALGRPDERELNAPRPVDIDILLFGKVTRNNPRLTIPHPRMKDRAFVLCPLADLRPEFSEEASGSDQSGIRKTERELFATGESAELS